jgi:hypothetical protein
VRGAGLPHGARCAPCPLRCTARRAGCERGRRGGRGCRRQSAPRSSSPPSSVLSRSGPPPASLLVAGTLTGQRGAEDGRRQQPHPLLHQPQYRDRVRPPPRPRRPWLEDVGEGRMVRVRVRGRRLSSQRPNLQNQPALDKDRYHVRHSRPLLPMPRLREEPGGEGSGVGGRSGRRSSRRQATSSSSSTTASSSSGLPCPRPALRPRPRQGR